MNETCQTIGVLVDQERLIRKQSLTRTLLGRNDEMRQINNWKYVYQDVFGEESDIIYAFLDNFH